MALTLEPAQSDHQLDRKRADSTGTQSPGQESLSHPLGGVLSALGADGSDAGSSRLISSPLLQRRMNGELRAVVMRRVQQGAGNFKTQQLFAQLRRSAVVQRECSCGSCAACQEKGGTEEEEAKIVQRQPASAAGDGTANADVIPSESAGEPLDRQTRDFMEPRFGDDFSDVRVHSDALAARSAEALGAEAYTTGRDIYFGAGKYAPRTTEGQHLLAHELTHTVQQKNGDVSEGSAAQTHRVVVGSPESPFEAEAESVADHVVSAPAQPLSISADRQAPVRGSWKDDAKAAWNATGGKVVNYVGEKAANLAEGTREWFIAKVEQYAPGLMTLLQGGVVDYLKDQIGAGLDAIFGGLTQRIQKDGFLGAITGIIGELVTGLSKAASGLVASACESFAHAAEVVTSFAKSIAGQALDGIKKTAAAVGDVFSSLWKDIGAPVWDAIKHVAGAVWKWIEDKAKWIWDKTAPIRDGIATVWNWIKKQFGLAWESGTGVLDWLKEKAKAAWDKIYEVTKPIHGPLKVIGVAFLIISGAGPIILIWKGAPLLWDALSWLYDQWKKTDFIVIARTVLTERILPAIASGAQTAASLLEAAATWISEQVDSLNTALGGLLDALGASSLLSLARKAVQFVADEFRKFASWVKTDFFKTLHKVKEILLKIWNFIKPILAFLIKLEIVVTNPLLIPIVLTGYLWQALPACFKPPIIDFVLDLLIAVVRALPTFKIFGESWPPTKAKILGALTEVRNSTVEKRIEASNRVARIMSGDDLEWLGNLLSAMTKVPDFIEGQFEEELIGMNLTEPLPFERSAPPTAGDTVSQSVAAGTLPAADAALLSNPNLAAGQIGVDQVANLQLEPDLVQDLQSQGGEKEFRGPEDPSRSIAGIQADLTGGGAPAGKSATPGGPESTGVAEPAAAAPKSTDEELEAFMNQPAPETCTQEKPAKTEASVIPESLKIGPLTRGQRARYLLHQIGQGIKTWFKCNAYWLVPAIIGVIAVLVAVEILTGGAVTAALPAIMDILTAIMIGVAAVRSAVYMAEYVAKAITGDVAGAAKSLARGLAIIGIELIFALLFNLDKVIKTLKQGLRATAEAAAKAAKAAVKGTIESVEELGRIGVKGIKTAGRNIAGFGRAIVRNGKLLLEGIGEGFAKGIRKLQELFERLWNKLRFKAFRIRLSGAWFRLEGEINPWVLLAEGKIEWIEKANVLEGKGAKLGGKVVGKSSTGELIEGLFVGASKVKPDYRAIAEIIFKDELAKANKKIADFVVHHAIEQQVPKKIVKGLFSLEEIHGGSNLRLILKGAFNSEVHLSQIRTVLNRFYTALQAEGLTGDAARRAVIGFTEYLDGYIEAITKFMQTDEEVLKALAAGDNATVRALLEKESAKLLSGAEGASTKAISTATAVGAGS